jgi:hypothetical protein
VKRHHAAAAAVTALALGLALLAGEARLPALLGAAIATGTGLASLVALGHFDRRAARPLQATLAVFAVVFLLRLVLVGAGVAVVARAGASAIAFVVAFFVPYFAFVAIEGSYVHALGRRMRKTA